MAFKPEVMQLAETPLAFSASSIFLRPQPFWRLLLTA